MTGVTSLGRELAPKRLGLLHELMPTASVMALLVNPTNTALTKSTTRDVQAAAHALGLQLHVLHAGSEHDFDAVFETLIQLRASALVIAVDFYFTVRRGRRRPRPRHGVPAVYQYRDFAAART